MGRDYTSDRVVYPYVYQMASGLSVYLPPETLVTPIGMAGNGKNQPDFVTQLRSRVHVRSNAHVL